jgi:uncharacterized protein with ParB-like and HNH nuclease domain
MAKIIDVEERDLDFIFNRTRPYSLDVYQRDYRWADTKEYKIVTQLLKDIELRFDNNYDHNKKNTKEDLKDILNDVETNFKSYFLNTIMLNEQGENFYIVDGQQRLTTLLLILISLYHIGKDSKSDKLFNIDKFIGEKIFEEDKAGEKHFKISNEDRNTIVEKIFNRAEITSKDILNISQKNLYDNYLIIKKYFEKYFNFIENFDYVKFIYYFYFLTSKVLIIEQVIKNQEDVAMIFETANDRGKELEPHEVLKGMLLGVLNTKTKESCNIIWNKALSDFFEEDEDYQYVDDFFRTYFRAKYADNQSQYQSFAGKYHRNLLSNAKVIADLDRSNPEKIEEFIKKDFQYFYKLYLKIWDVSTDEKDLFVASNYANEQNQQMLLILSAIKFNDIDEDEKISLVAKKLDQLYTISKLLGIYDSNKHQELIYDINLKIRDKNLDIIEHNFNEVMLKFFMEKGYQLKDFKDIFDYKYFENAKHDGRFTKYLLARVDRYLADILNNEQSFAKQNKLHFITHSGTSPVNGFHIEHMFANNSEIMNQFLDNNGIFDEIAFNTQRNRLGALILLKGNENIRTSNWIYKKKFNSYAHSGFIWNRILTNSINQASLKSTNNPIVNNFKSYQPNIDGLLDKTAIDERQKLLFEIIKEIWK